MPALLEFFSLSGNRLIAFARDLDVRRRCESLGRHVGGSSDCIRVSGDTRECPVGGRCPLDRHRRELRIMPALPVVLPFTIASMAALIGLGTLAMMLPVRRDGIVTTGITTVVVTVVAAINPQDAWHQPPLRLVDTIVGVGIGVAC